MSPSAVEVTALLLAVVAAARSTWSPCGISMLSTLTPLGERSRGHRYSATCGWFVLGAVGGGVTLGAVCAAPAYLLGRWAPSATATAAIVAGTALVTVGSDLRVGGLRLPTVPRQVDELWTHRFRPWVYATGFGAQIGVGVATYVMSAAVYLVAVLAVLTGRPVAALAVGACFGLVRGLAILASAGLTTPAAIRAFHRRFEALATASLALAVAAQLGVLAVALPAPAGAPIAVALAVAAAARALMAARRRPLAAG